MSCFLIFFFFTDPSATEIYTLSLHDALPIYRLRRPRYGRRRAVPARRQQRPPRRGRRHVPRSRQRRSEEHTSELQSRPHLVCRLLLEKKKNKVTASVVL